MTGSIAYGMMLVKMQDTFLTCLKITEHEVVSFMIGNSVRYLLPFFNKESSVSQAAKKVGGSLAKTHYWVNKMLELGLIKQTRIEQRKGSPIKYYRSVANEFRIAMTDIPLESLQEMLEAREKRYVKRLYKSLANAMVRYGNEGSDEWEVSFHMEGANPTTGIQPRQGTPEDAKIFSYWMPLSLSPEQAKDLRAELRDIQARYAQFSTDNKNQYPTSLVHLFIVQEG